MHRNTFWAAGGKVSAAVTVTLCVILVLVSSAWGAEYKVVYKFAGGRYGGNPYGGLIFDSAGNLYGTTVAGGNLDSCSGSGCGLVFRLTPNPDGSWTRSTLHSFKGKDGAYPYAGLIFDSAGNLYGTTTGAIAGACQPVGPCGTVFRLTPNQDGSWTESVLYNFTHGADGGAPYAGVIFDATGNLYGTTAGGGYGWGTVFKLTPNRDGWTETVLYSFTGGADGWCPVGGLVFDATDNLYSTTWLGGPYGMGEVFKLAPSPDGGWTEQVIGWFGGQPATKPRAGLIFDQSGNLYGTTFGTAVPPALRPMEISARNHYAAALGGTNDSSGTVFQLTPNPDGSWKKRMLHAFKGKDGAYPYAGLIFDSAGNLYGTTVNGGAYNSGTVFKLTAQPDGHWVFTKLHVFRNGEHPYAGLVMDAAGNLYGTTTAGGRGYGVVFQITP